jgi:hypothetical protein
LLTDTITLKVLKKTSKSPKSSLKKILNAVDATYSKKRLEKKAKETREHSKEAREVSKEPENNRNLINQIINQ